MLTDVGREVCERQQELFEFLYDMHVDVMEYIYIFMNSDFCNQELDTPYSPYQLSLVSEWKSLMKEEMPIRPVLQRSQTPDRLESGFLGYMYRMVQISTGMPSAELVRVILPPQELAERYLDFEEYGEEGVLRDILQRHSLVLKDPDGNFLR